MLVSSPPLQCPQYQNQYCMCASLCADINECNSQNGGCGQLCRNNVGSFFCDCNSGYGLAPDGRSCNSESPFYADNKSSLE